VRVPDYDITSAQMDVLQDTTPRTAAGREDRIAVILGCELPSLGPRDCDHYILARRIIEAGAAEPAPLDALDADTLAWALSQDEGTGTFQEEAQRLVALIRARLAAGDNGATDE